MRVEGLTGMGTKVDSRSYLAGFYSMRDLNENSSNSNWPLSCGDKIVPNGQYYNGFLPTALADSYDKDSLKQKMLEHEAVFKNQVGELHRLYRIQRDMMEEAKRKEMYYRASVEPASSSSQVRSEDAQKWHMAGFPLLNSSYGRTSILGAENFSSLLSCTNGQLSQSPFQNRSASKHSEALDSRPLKVRKKLFDLQLPAHLDEDIEEEENLHDYKASHMKGTASQSPFHNGSTSKDSALDSRSSKARNKSFDLQLPANLYEDLEYRESEISSCTGENGAKLFIGSRVSKKTDRSMEILTSVSRSKGLADLNEPIQCEEAKAPLPVDFPGRKPTSRYLGVTGDSMLVQDGFSINSSMELQVNDRGWLSCMNGAGSSRGNASSLSNQLDKLPLPSNPGKGTYPGGEGLCKERFRHGLESCSRNYDKSTNTHFEPIASQTPSPYPFLSSSWAKSTQNFSQNVTSLETSGDAAATVSRTLHPSNEFFGRKWADSSSRLIPGFASETNSNAGFDYLNCSRRTNVASHRSTNHGFRNYPNADSKPVIDINLNETLIMQDSSTPDGKSKPDDNFHTLPWLRPKDVCGTSKSELSRGVSLFRSTSNQVFYQNETVRDSEISRTKETSQTKIVQKILGVPVFERDTPENVPSSCANNFDCRFEEKSAGNERKKGIIDINIACEPDEQIGVEEPNVAKEKEKNSSSINQIDLNCCASDSEDPPLPCSKRTLEIDLEAPVFLESEDDGTLPKDLETEQEKIKDEVVRNLAEAIVSISANPPQEDLPSEASVEEALVWFVDVVSSCKNVTSPRSSDHEMDDFEAMTLQLPEMREEDYTPMPFVHEIQEMGGGNASATRSRRGYSRRGRQRRDFQRDILPGLTSLSRHEVTEDLQTFGGIMRDTGHSWNSGSNRRNGTRNGGGRGRRRAVVETDPVPIPVCSPLIQQLNSIEAVLEDQSLTGWGKTTRRPRRQRCHAGGNPPTVALR